MKTKRILLLLLLSFQLCPSYCQWQIIPSGTTNNLVDICFVNDTIGYLLSNNGEVLKTIDEGNTWTSIAQLSGTFTSLSHLGKDTVFAGGSFLYRSSNAGASWSNIGQMPYITIDMEFFNAAEGICIKQDSSQCGFGTAFSTYIEGSELYKTNDSGASWQLINSNFRKTSRIIRRNDSTAFIPGADYTIWAHCAGQYNPIGFYTNDKGLTWSNSSIYGDFVSEVNDSVSYFVRNPVPGYYEFNGSLFSTIFSAKTLTFSTKQLLFVNNIVGYILNEDSLFKTTNIGASWFADTIPVPSLNKLLSLSNKALLAIGDNGVILKNLHIDSIFSFSCFSNNINFGNVIIGNTKIYSDSIINLGTLFDTIIISVQAPFLVSSDSINFSNTLTFIISSLQRKKFYVSFTPTDTLIYIDSINLSSNHSANQKISLSGKGTNLMTSTENNLQNQFTIFPNPTGNQINIAFQQLPNNTQTELFDSKGNLVVHQIIKSKTIQLDLSQLSKGLYYLIVKSENKIIGTKKVSKE